MAANQALCAEIAQQILDEMPEEEKAEFDYLFTLTNPCIYFGISQTKCFGRFSFQDRYTDLLTFFTQEALHYGSAHVIKNCAYDRDVVKCTAYLDMVVVHCVGLIMEKKKDLIIKGSIRNWSLGGATNKYRIMYIAKTGKDSPTTNISFVFWPNDRSVDYVKVLVSYDLYRDPNYLSNVNTGPTIKVKVSRSGSNQIQRTVSTKLEILWQTVKNLVDEVTAKTAI